MSVFLYTVNRVEYTLNSQTSDYRGAVLSRFLQLDNFSSGF